MPQAITREMLAHFHHSSELLGLLDEAGITRLARHGTHVALPEDAVIVRQGEVGDAFYLVLRGEVRVLVGDAGEREVARLSAGKFFGEMAVITRQPRSATVQAHGPVELARFARDPAVRVLQDYPKARELLGRTGLARTEQNLTQPQALDEDGGGGGLADLLEPDP